MANTYRKQLKIDEINDSSIYFEGLTANSFAVDVKNVTCKILDSMGHNVGHYSLHDIVSIDIKDNVLVINTSDEVPNTYVFLTTADAEIVNQKIDNFINGIY